MQEVPLPLHSDARGSESPLATITAAQGDVQLKISSYNRCEDELGDPLAPHDLEGLPAQIDEYDPDLSPVVGIYGSRTVDNSHAICYGETAAGPHLHFKPWRNRQGKTGGDKRSCPRFNDAICFEISLHVHAGISAPGQPGVHTPA